MDKKNKIKNKYQMVCVFDTLYGTETWIKNKQLETQSEPVDRQTSLYVRKTKFTNTK